MSGNVMRDIRIVRAASPVCHAAEERTVGSPKMGVKAIEKPRMRYRELQNNSDKSEEGSGSRTSSTYYSMTSNAITGNESEGTINLGESAGEYDQRHSSEVKQTSTKRNMLIATPSSVYSIKQCDSDANTQPTNPSSTPSTPRQRRLTCAERMVMINQRQQTPLASVNSDVNTTESSRNGTPTYAMRECRLNSSPRSPPPIQPLMKSTYSPNSAKIYMQSGIKSEGPVTTILPRNTSVRTNLEANQQNSKYQPSQISACALSPRNPDSTKIMQKLFHSENANRQEDKNESNKQQSLMGQRINVNDLMRGFSGASPIRSTEPSVSRPNSSTNAAGAGSGIIPNRRPLSAAIIDPPMGVGGIVRNRNYSGNSLGNQSFAGGDLGHYNKRRTPPAPDSPPTAPLAHQAFGEFKLFKDQQQANPMRLQIANSQRRAVLGPSGIPEVDCSNGYRSYSEYHSATMMGDPLDPELDSDFDFAGNLALFDKQQFNRETEHIFQGLDSGGDHSRNYRNDENVLQNSNRVISWTKSGSGDEINNRDTSSSSPAD